MNHLESPYFAAIDLGSNSFHMLIVRINEDKIEVVDREKNMVQIARGLQANGTLDEASQERAVICLHQFSERLRGIPTSQIRAVGTKTLRSAENSTKFLKAAERVLGVKIQTISGYEEARLVYKGLSSSNSKSEQRLVIDIGGGSTEFIIGEDQKPVMLESLAMGCVSFSNKYELRGDQVTRRSMLEAYYAACIELEEIRKNYIKKGWEVAYGTSGTMKAVAELLEEKDGGAVLTKKSLDELVQDTIAAGKITSSKPNKLRKDVLPAGLAILQAIFDLLELDRVLVSNATLKEGVIYDTLGRLENTDTRSETVETLKKQYAIDDDQAQRVNKAALDFWAGISGPNLPGVSRSKILSWAAQLHEIGLNISHSGYHHHGYYVLRHGDLAGFGRYEQYILANLVRLHRKKLQGEKMAGLDNTARVAFIPLLICLRLSALLFRRRENIDELPHLSEQNGDYILKFKGPWLDEHPLTRAGLEQEQEYWKNTGINLTVDS